MATRNPLISLKTQDARDLLQSYAEHKSTTIVNFLQTFVDPKMSKHEKYGQRKYMIMLQELANRWRTTLVVDGSDIEAYWLKLFEEKSDQALECERMGKGVAYNTNRYVDYFREAATQLMPEKDKNFNDAAPEAEYDRVEKWRATRDADKGKSNLPPQLLQNFDVRFHMSTLKKDCLRNIKARNIGGLVTIDGVVTKVSMVKPRMHIVAYHCHACNGEIFQVIDGDSYKPMTQCPTPTCKSNKTSNLEQKLRGSKFTRFQEVRIQEPHHEVPVGSVPRQILLHFTGDLCRTVLPGDAVSVTGVYNIMKQSGPMARFSDSLLFLTVHRISKHKQGYADTDDAEIEKEVTKMNSIPRLYENLAMSIAPEIFGHLDVKKALLLALVGGATQSQADGMKIRGDIHVLLMGDPGVAKSQLLKQVCKIAPRSVYTTGKGSSGVGLTAAVIRDPQTGEMTLEGGALILADNGVCCIDEFDKMEEGDRTAIHEVMEQQVLNLAKAGITTTLNARCSLLAAANPIYGRYNPEKSPMDNMGLPAALLSRFDLKFLLLDHTDADHDLALAKHVLDVHRYASKDGSGPPPQVEVKPYDAVILRAYIKRARTFSPTVQPELKKILIQKYVETRQNERGLDVDDRQDYTTARSLLGILRLCQGLARLKFSTTINEDDYLEATRLIDASKESVMRGEDDDEEVDADPLFAGRKQRGEEEDDAIDPEEMRTRMQEMQQQEAHIEGGNQAERTDDDVMTSIFELIRAEMERDGTNALFDNAMRQKVMRRGYSEEDYMLCLEYYMDLNIFEWSNEQKTAFRFKQ